MKIFITGAEGFVGKNLRLYFVKKGYKVIYPTLNEIDLTNSNQVKKFFLKNINIDVIINCATTPQIDKNYDDKVVEYNLKIFFNLLNFKKKSTKLINLGSGSEYSRNNWSSKMRESYFGTFVPDDSHSFSKFIQSKYIQDSKDKNLYHLRLFGIFGKYEDYKYKFISNTIAKAIYSRKITINQNCVYDYLYIEDFAKITELFIRKKPRQKIYNITPTQSIDLISIAKIVLNVLNKNLEINVLKTGYGREYTGSNAKLMKTFPAIKFTPFEKSITSLISYFIKNKSLINFKELKKDNFLRYAKKIN